MSARTGSELRGADTSFPFIDIAKGDSWWFSIDDLPGTTRRLVLPSLEKSGCADPSRPARENENVGAFLPAFSPEREDPGHKNSWVGAKIQVVGMNPPSGRAAQALYTQVYRGS